MAKYLKTTGISYHLDQLIENAKLQLILISPYLKFNQRIKSTLEDKNKFKLDIRLVYRKNELQPEENNWLKGLQSVRSSILNNLHAKCYLNENEAIITSMNLYEFSQVNNEEMGILIKKEEDQELYKEIYDEAMRLVRESDEIQITVAKIPKEKPKKTKSTTKSTFSDKAFCIRCKTEIKLDPLTPYCKKCYSLWKKYENPEYKEKYCHICAKENASTLLKPTCYSCYKANKNKLQFPIA